MGQNAKNSQKLAENTKRKKEEEKKRVSCWIEMVLKFYLWMLQKNDPENLEILHTKCDILSNLVIITSACHLE
jgi:hypothetical protein